MHRPRQQRAVLSEVLLLLGWEVRRENFRYRDTIENIDTIVKENTKCKKVLTKNIQEIQGTMRQPNLWIIDIEES